MSGQRHNPRECWCGVNHAFGQGEPPAGGWKLSMSEDARKPTYDHEWVSQRINENNRRGVALREIAEKARWYAENDARDPHEVDYALCVEIFDLAEKALNG